MPNQKILNSIPTINLCFMIVRDRHRGNPVFTYEGNFGPSIPLMEPETLINLQINHDSNPVILHVTSRISGSHGSNEFAYEIEENIEIDTEGETLNAEELLEEVISSGNRCFESAYSACIDQSLSFPFPRTLPQFDRHKALRDIEHGLD